MNEPIPNLGPGIFIEGKEFTNLHLFFEQPAFRSAGKYILADSNTAAHCLPVLKRSFPEGYFQEIIIPAGEKNKNLQTCQLIWDALAAKHAGRADLLINLGGGMITDLGGFAASVYKRGLPFIHIPTTLLSMVDAAIGGKTGIDYGNYKNQIGTFREPAGNFIFSGFLETLERRDKKSGIAEMIKHALIADHEQWKDMQAAGENQFYSGSAIGKSASIKIKIAGDDPFEKGNRRMLNFGHTIGHAIESFSLVHDQDSLLHGEAIAMGLICESWLSHELYDLGADELEKICSCILRFYEKYTLTENDIPELLSYMRQDKKNRNQSVNFSLITSPGKGVVDIAADDATIAKALTWYMSR